MQQFFAEPSWITESEILIRGADLNHMKNVLRMKVGEDVRINDGQGTTYLCCLNRYEKDQAVLDVFRKLVASITVAILSLTKAVLYCFLI